jgi:hypothetical protein
MGSCLDRGEVSCLLSSLTSLPSPLFPYFPTPSPFLPLSLPFSKRTRLPLYPLYFCKMKWFARWPCG